MREELCAEGRGCLHSNSAAGQWPQPFSSGSVSHPPSSTLRTPRHHPKIKLALGCGSGWVLEPRAFLDLSPRCSSEELLDRLFKKSVVTEAEVTTGLHAPPDQTTCPSKYSPPSHSVPQLRDLLGSPGLHRVSQHPSQLSKLPQTQALTISPSQPTPGQWASPHLLLRHHDYSFAQATPHTHTLPTFGSRGIPGIGARSGRVCT